MPTQLYYNTNCVTGPELKDQVAKCLTQESACLKIYLSTRRPFTVSDILGMCELSGHKWIKVSIGRAVTNLCTKGEIVRLTAKKTSVHGKTEIFYQVNFKKYPTKPLNQGVLFG